MVHNKIKHALRSGQAVFGIGLTRAVEIPELRVLANCGVEWIFLDMEHGSIEVGDLLRVVQIADLLGVCSVIRVPDLDYHWIARALDTGALSVMVPRIESREQAERAVRWAKFPPIGTRGMGSPTYLSQAPVSWAEGLEISNRETMVVLQIETKAGVENLEAIATVPGVDVLFIGPLDLSISLGHPGEVSSQHSHAVYEKVCRTARQHGLAVGIVCRADQSRLYYDIGIRMFSSGTALGYLQSGTQAAAAEFREQIPSQATG